MGGNLRQTYHDLSEQEGGYWVGSALERGLNGGSGGHCTKAQHTCRNERATKWNGKGGNFGKRLAVSDSEGGRRKVGERKSKGDYPQGKGG